MIQRRSNLRTQSTIYMLTYKVSFLRAARTDKGVHASVNVISLKMIIEDPDILDKINAELPKQVRVWKILRTMKSFNPRTSCDSRIYEYLLPTSAFLPPSDETPYALKIRNYNVGTILHDNGAKFWTEIAKSLSELEQSAHYQSIDDNDADVGVLALDSSIPDSEKPAAHAKLRRLKLIKQHLIDQKRQYRISPERLQLIRNALDNYQGTRNFHNYTVGQTFDQPNSKRVIKTFTTGEPFLINGTEWVSLKVHGQSFMLHQIRKMVAMVILLVRSSSPISQMASSFGRQKINIPKAPSLGLLLERPIFDVYNRKAGEITDKSNIELGDMDATVTQFKLRHIYDKIYAEEEIENVFHNFISSLDAYAAAGEFNYLFANAPKEEGNKLAAGAEAKSSDSDATSHVAKPTKLGVVSPEALAGNIIIAGLPSTSLMD